jgi:hypothetical protein
LQGIGLFHLENGGRRFSETPQHGQHPQNPLSAFNFTGVQTNNCKKIFLLISFQILALVTDNNNSIETAVQKVEL